MFEMVDPLPGALKLKMPRFVIAWTIVDLVMCSLRTLELPFVVTALFLLNCHDPDIGPARLASLRLIFWLELGSVLAIVLSGLPGNIAMLCRRRCAQYFGLICSFMTLVSYGIVVWQMLIFLGPCSFFALSMGVIAVTLFIMMRIALLVFNLLSLFRARLFFKERDGY